MALTSDGSASWLVITPPRLEAFDGIADFSARLTGALAAQAPTALVEAGAAAGPWHESGGSATAIFLQYAPHLLSGPDHRPLLRWLRAAHQRSTPIVVTMHEMWPPPNGSLRRTISRALHRRRVWRACALATHLVCPQGRSARELRAAGLPAATPITLIPVGSNIERADQPPLAPRSQYTVTLFGQPAAMHRPTLAAVAAWLDRRGGAVTLRWLNRSEPEARQVWQGALGLPDAHVEFFGGLDTAHASAVLASGDLALAPYDDGVSTRRTTLAAQLQHGRPVIGTDGPSTDDLLRHSPALDLVPLTRPSVAEDVVARLDAALDDPARRSAMSTAARDLYDTALSWPTIAAAYASLVRPGAPAPKRNA